MTYSSFVVETYQAIGEQSSKSLRARPLPGQGVDTDMKVECSSKMRDSQPAGTLFHIHAKITDREGGPDFLYTSFRWPYEVVSPERAKKIIAARQQGLMTKIGD